VYSIEVFAVLGNIDFGLVFEIVVYCLLLWKNTSWNSLATYGRITFDSIGYV